MKTIEISSKKISMQALPQDEREYLQGAEAGDIPVFYKDDKILVQIEGVGIKSARDFEKSRPKNLFRGGGVIKVQTNRGVIVFYDDRYTWWRLPGGLASTSDASLIETARRELLEEVYVTDSNEKVRYIPEGSHRHPLQVPMWGFAVEEAIHQGQLTAVYDLNKDNGAVEAIVTWDISKLGDVLIVTAEDGWFRGGNTAPTPYCIDDTGTVIGIYEPRKGFVDIKLGKLHPSLQIALGL